MGVLKSAFLLLLLLQVGISLAFFFTKKSKTPRPPLYPTWRPPYSPRWNANYHQGFGAPTASPPRRWSASMMPRINYTANSIYSSYQLMPLQQSDIQSFGGSAEVLQKIKDGFGKGKELFTQLKDKPFVQSIQKTSKWGLPLLKSVGFFAKFIKGFFETESKELAYMKEQFELINNKMDSLEKEFGDVKNMIDWSAVKVSFGTYERVIRILEDQLNIVIEAPKEIKDIMIDKFKTAYEREFREATGKLYEAVVNPNLIFSENLIVAIRKYTKDHLTELQYFLNGLLWLIMKGAQIDISHLSFQYPEDGVTFWSNVWDERFKKLEEIFLQTDAEVEGRWYQQAEVDIEDFNAQNNGLSNEQYNSQLYSFLTDKFPSRQWFTLIYNPLSGGDAHYVFACGGFIKFRSRGKNVVIGSAAKEHTNFNTGDANAVLNSIPKSYRGFPDRAHLLLNMLLEKTGQNCDKYSMAGVVGYGQNVWFAGPPNRRAYLHYKGFQWSGAGRSYRRRNMDYNIMLFG